MVGWRGLSAPLLVVSVLVLGQQWPASSARPSDSPTSDGEAGRAERLEMYYSPPVLVRAGERVLLPVDVICATRAGRPCRAKVTLATRAARSSPWQLSSADGSGVVLFDVSAPARAAERISSGRVSFYLRAEARGDGPGGSVSLPEREAASPLSFYVTPRMPLVQVPTASFGTVRRGEVALSVPWGSDPRAAGLIPGRESTTLGPSSFDVDREGTIHVADTVQDRIAVFMEGKLVRQTLLPLGSGAAMAVTAQGVSYVADRDGRQAIVRRIDRAGRPGPALPIGEGIPSQVRTLGELAFVHLLPLDAWVPVSGSDPSAASPTVGMPAAPGTDLLRVATERFVRLGLVSEDGVSDAVELRLGRKVGDVPLAESAGEGYLTVAHVWQDSPPADQYQVVRVAGTRIVSTFAVADSRFADTPPLSKFRLGKDGYLYQLTTSPSGVRILRFDIGEES